MNRTVITAGLVLLVGLMIVLDRPTPSDAQFWSRFRQAITGGNRDTSGGSQTTSKCDKGESYKPDGCNTCHCVGSGYRCTLKYCDESLASLPAFQFD